MALGDKKGTPDMAPPQKTVAVQVPSLRVAFIGLFVRDLRLAWSQGGTGTMVISFFVIAVSLFPFGVGPLPQLLSRMAPGVLLVVALLATLISLDRLFQGDFEDGTLEQYKLSPIGMGGIVAAKILAHWIATLVPLVVLAPIVGGLLNLPADLSPFVVLVLLIMTPALSFIGAIGAALTVAMRRGGVLLSLLVLPLYIPSLIFAAGSLNAASLGEPVGQHLALLGSVTLFAGLLALPASTAALNLAIESLQPRGMISEVMRACAPLRCAGKKTKKIPCMLLRIQRVLCALPTGYSRGHLLSLQQVCAMDFIRVF